MNSAAIKKSLAPALANQLDALSNANHTGAGCLTERVNEVCLTARLISVDRLACEAELIAVSHPPKRDLNLTQLRERADRLASQLFYLEESLVVVEIDQLTPEIQLRSESPRQDEQARTYFEVQVGQRGIALRRFEKRPGDARQAINAVLTRDVFCRLCIDLVSIVHE